MEIIISKGDEDGLLYSPVARDLYNRCVCLDSKAGIHLHLEAHQWTSKLRLQTQKTAWFTLQRHTQLSSAAQTHRDIYWYLNCLLRATCFIWRIRALAHRLLKLLLKLQQFTLKPQHKSAPLPCIYFKLTSGRLTCKEIPALLESVIPHLQSGRGGWERGRVTRKNQNRKQNT